MLLHKAVDCLKKGISVLFALSLVVNVLLGAAYIRNTSVDTAKAAKDIKRPGTYGPPAMEIIDDDVTVGTADVTLQNTLITGNLYLSEGVGEGTVTLDQVDVQGDVVIAAGGELTLVLADCSLRRVVVEHSGGAVTIVAKGSTSVDSVVAAAETTLQEDGLSDDARGFSDVQITTDKRVVLLGNFHNVDIAAAAASVKVIKGNLTSINVKGAAGNSELDLTRDVTVEKLTLEAMIKLAGAGNVQAVAIKAPGLVQLHGTLGEVSLQVGGIFLQLKAGSIDKLIVPDLESPSSINLAADTRVETMELNGRTGVTGQGQIGTAIIAQSGVEIAQTPETIVIEEGLVAMINGEEYWYEPQPEPEPEPTTPTVALNSIGNVSMKNFGERRTITLSATPGASLTASSSSNVASVSLSGNTLTITGNRQGTATITVRATMSGYNSRTRTFRVTVDPIKSVERKSMTEVTHTVAVILHNNDPNRYKVELQGFGELTFDTMDGVSKFWAIVPAGVQNNSIIVTGR